MATDEELADIWMDAINAPRTDNRLASFEDSILRKWGQPYKGDEFFGSSYRFEDNVYLPYLFLIHNRGIVYIFLETTDLHRQLFGTCTLYRIH